MDPRPQWRSTTAGPSPPHTIPQVVPPKAPARCRAAAPLSCRLRCVSQRPFRLGPGPAVVAILLSLAHPCAAADPEELYVAALADMKRADYASACPRFAEARRLKPDATPALQGLALCLDKKGATASAWSRYRELTVELKAQGDVQRAQTAADRADELAKILSTVMIRVEAGDMQGLILRLDKEDVPKVMLGSKMNVDPGTHVLEASAPGYQVWQTTF